jgi:hypothetical protein
MASREAELFAMNSDGTRAGRWPVELNGDRHLPSWWHTPNSEITEDSADKMTSSDLIKACGDTDTVHPESRSYRDPTGRFELVLKSPDEMTSQSCAWGFFRTFWIRRLAGGREIAKIEMSGEKDLEQKETNTMWVEMENDTPWISIPPLLTFIWGQHIGSTNGSLILAANPEAGAVHLISQHGAKFFRLPDIPALVVLNDQRYEATGDGKSGNCLSPDLWDTEFQRHVLSPEKSVFGGASFFQPERSPRNDSVHSIPVEWKMYGGKTPF